MAKKSPPPTPREQFAARLRELADGKEISTLAASWGVTPGMVYKYLRGEKMPDIDRWPTIASSLGLSSWTDLVPKV